MVKPFAFLEEGQTETPTEYLSIKDNEIKYLLINAVKEQQKMIEELQVNNKGLRDRIEALEAGINR